MSMFLNLVQLVSQIQSQPKQMEIIPLLYTKFEESILSYG